MENKKSILTGSLIAAAFGGLTFNADASNLTSFSSLGSGAEVRTILLGAAVSNNNAFELKCGAKDSTGTKQAKGKDGKCGEGKCGEGKKKDAKASNAKAKDGKCGQGKCGEGKKETK